MNRELLQQAYTTLLHARNFIVSKERMHPTGVDLYEKLVYEICDELAKPEQEPVSHLWECIGRWSAYLAANGKQGNLAPPTWLVDAVKAATSQPRKEWVGLSVNETRDFFESKLTRAELITEISEFLEEKNNAHT